MTFLIPRILTFSDSLPEPSICLSWPPAAGGWIQWCTGRAGAGPRAPAATTNLPRTNLPPPAAAAAARTAAPRHGTRPRPPARHAAATRPELTCVGCSGSESAAARPSPGPAALSTAVCSLHRARPGYRQETRREAAATESQSVTSGQCRSAESPSCHLPRYCRYSRHLYLHKSPPPPPPPPHSRSGGCWTRCPRA